MARLIASRSQYTAIARSVSAVHATARAHGPSAARGNIGDAAGATVSSRAAQSPATDHSVAAANRRGGDAI